MRKFVVKSYFSFKYIFFLVLVLVVYIIAGKLGLQLAFINASATAIWPPTGIALAAILLFGYRMTPAILIGAFIVNISTSGNVPTSIGIAFGNTLEAIVGAYLVNRYANGPNAFQKVQDVFRFALFAGLISTMTSATIGVVTISLGGLAAWKDFISIWITWWLGDTGGNLIVAPFVLLLLGQRFKFLASFRQILDVTFYLLVVIFVSELVFSGIAPYPYLIFPVLVWGAFSFGQREAATAIILIAIVSVWNTLHGLGPYAQTPQNINTALLLVQLFLGACAVTAMTFTAALLERRQARLQLQGAEQKYRALIEKSFEAVVLIDATSKIIYASPSVKKLLGYKPEEMIGIVGFDLVVPEDRKVTMAELGRLVLQPGGVVTVEYRTIRKDKQVIWVEATGTNLLFEPSVHAVVVNFRDITERKEASDKLEREKAEDDALLASIGEGLIATDATGKITLVNDAAIKLLKCKEKDLIGKYLTKAISMEDESGEKTPVIQRPMTKVLSSLKPIVTSPTLYYVRFDKTRFPVMFTLTPIVLNGKLIGTVEVFRDITEETEVDRAKTEFVSLASHQLRTPLTTINWYSERLIGKKVGDLSLQQKKYLEEIYSAGQRMGKLINALLNVSRLELGTFAVEPENVHIPTLANQLVKDFKFQIAEKNLIIKEEYAANFPIMFVDPKLLEIIIQNLLSNAVKYTPAGGTITISLSRDESFAKIIVTDTGYGIPERQKEKIFTKLFRADNILSVDTTGTGLGLYLVKLLLDKIGGTIKFTSQEKTGSSFAITLPISGMRPKKGTKYLEGN